MPTYIYRREDGTTFEIDQRITADPLKHCPTSGQAVTRVITGGTGLIFKGSGFYLTDYARGNGKNKKNDPNSTTTTEKATDTSDKTESSSDSTSSEKTTTTKSTDSE